MAQSKKRFLVTMWEEQTYYGRPTTTSEERTAGVTYAVSERQAISQIKHRMGLKNADLECHGSGYYRKTCFQANPM